MRDLAEPIDHLLLMRIILAFVVLSFLLPVVHAGTLFREVQVTKEGWSVTFHEEGIRYRIEIDGFDRGISGYLQKLKLKSQERLQLFEKHGVLNIRPGEKDGQQGISITMVYRDISTGEKKTKMEFIANHGHPPAEEKDQKGK